MQIFQFRGGVIGDYAEYITSFINLADPRIKQTVQESLVAGLLWRDPLVQINPTFEPGATVDELVLKGAIDSECGRVFRRDKRKTDGGLPLNLHCIAVCFLPLSFASLARATMPESQGCIQLHTISMVLGSVTRSPHHGTRSGAVGLPSKLRLRNCQSRTGPRHLLVIASSYLSLRIFNTGACCRRNRARSMALSTQSPITGETARFICLVTAFLLTNVRMVSRALHATPLIAWFRII